MPSSMIRINAADGSGQFDAYLALPAAGHGPGLVIAQAMPGGGAST